jgi:ankyrin repeat protein
MNLQSQILTALSRISTFPSFRANSYRSILDPLILKDASGFAPLHYVAAFDDINLAEDLVYIFHHLGRMELLMPLDKQGRTPLHWAVDKGYLRMVKFFTENRLPLNTQDFDGCAPIHIAINAIHKTLPEKEEECREILSYLASKVDINVSDINGVSALHLASELGDLESIRVLIQNGAWVNIKDQQGEGALFYAVRGGHHEVIRALVEEFNINMEMLNEDDENVLDLCKAIGDQVLTDLVNSLLISRVNNQKMVGLLNETDSTKYSGQNIEIISSSGLIRFSGLSCA